MQMTPPAPKKPVPPAAPAPAKKPLAKAPVANRPVARAPKTFSTMVWDGANEGEKLIVYGASGMGKTTLLSMMPDPVFVGLDDGGRKIKNPKTGEPVRAVVGIETFDDFRDALHQKNLWQDCGSIVVDTATKLEVLAGLWVVENVKTEKGHTVKSIEGFGYGKGYTHILEQMRLVLQDLDPFVRKGVNIALICQETNYTVANAEGLDYIKDGPKLTENKQARIQSEFCEWADHVLRIGFLDTSVVGAQDAERGKIKSTDTTRCIYAHGARHFFAKSRTLQEPVISFAEKSDDSLWQLLFPPA